MVPAILNKCKTETGTIDFDDMIWLPLVNNYPLPHYPLLFVDEAQDFNEMQRELIVRVVNGGRCIIVGDPNQAIYGFRGADSNSMNMFRNRLERESKRNIVDLPLTVSWRCPTSVVKEANRYVADFHHAPNAKEGKVVENASFTPESGDMVLCRYNAPLVSAFYELISQGKSAYILGRDMTSGLINEVRKITKSDAMGIDEFKQLFKIHVDVQIQRLEADEKENQAMALSDKADCIYIFANRSETVGEMISNIKMVFDANEDGEIMLSTVHKAKGLEAHNVFILATERMPHPKGGHEENNICYVAITRAQENLFFCGPRPNKN
jgi:superfamily I DNA/RNA helicase